ncbi:MAG TPA: tetratricopeptide repeat protein [Candidatus Paceibacterota bacterium]|nr:tetratricopeptide repeat protein [Verrucomicrobiota bacterium]HRY47131.1 tetratricopeptide repeat protein [Candidatus Paceibacterota bacterium]
MKRIWAWSVALAFVLSAAGWAETLEETYIRIYHLIQDADSFQRSGQNLQAYDRYVQAQTALRQLQKVNPGWQVNLINYRLNYIKQRLGQLPIPPASQKQGPSIAGPEAAAATPAAPGKEPDASAPEGASSQVLQLTDAVRRLESEKTLLEARLKEALSAQPASVDPRELAKAETQLRSLQKENDLLKTTLQQEQERIGKLIDPAVMAKTQQALEDANRRLTEQVQLVATLTEEKKVLESRASGAGDRKEFQALQSENTRLKKQVNQLTAENRQIQSLQTDKQSLQKQLAEARDQAPPGNPRRLQSQIERQKTEIDSLRAENHTLTQQVADLKKMQDKDLTRRERRRLEEQKARIEELTSDNRSLNEAKEAMTTELASLKKRVQELENSPRETTSPRQTSLASSRDQSRQENERIRALEQERESLLRKINALNRELTSRKSQPERARWQQWSNEVSVLQARLAVLEAQKYPYSSEELALMRAPMILASNGTTNVAPTGPAPKPLPDLPSGSAPLVAEAQKAFAAGRYDEAEQKYRQVLSLNTRNTYTLGNLAAIQIEQRKWSEAETNLTQALELDPNDAYNLSLLGILRFRQNKFDEALTALSQSARLDPRNAETHNYLGITLSEKGFRDAAEAALRRAIQLQPDYANAHHNLAVIYATQNPPYLELARWHYQKALGAGHARNPEMEKVLLDRRPAAPQP